MTKPRKLPAKGAPSYACWIWEDTGWLYAELACGMITKFARTEGGLHKVLKLLQRESKPHANGSSRAKLPRPTKPSTLITPEEVQQDVEWLKRKGKI